MRGNEVSRRTFLGASARTALAGYGISRGNARPRLHSTGSEPGLSMRITFRALVDAVVPETPDLGNE